MAGSKKSEVEERSFHRAQRGSQKREREREWKVKRYPSCSIIYMPAQQQVCMYVCIFCGHTWRTYLEHPAQLPAQREKRKNSCREKKPNLGGSEWSCHFFRGVRHRYRLFRTARVRIPLGVDWSGAVKSHCFLCWSLDGVVTVTLSQSNPFRHGWIVFLICFIVFVLLWNDKKNKSKIQA